MEVTQISNESFLRYNAPFDNLSVPSTNSYRAVMAFRQLSLHQGQRKTKLIITYLYHISKKRSKNIFCFLFLKARTDQRNFSNLPSDVPNPETPYPGLGGVPVLTLSTAPQVFHVRF